MEVGEFLEELANILSEVTPIGNDDDMFCWLNEANGLFSINSCYKWLLIKKYLDIIDAEKQKLQRIWRSKVYSKVHIFGLRFVLNRLLTRSELEDRVLIDLSHNLVCALCFVEEEDLFHLLFRCSISIYVWKKVCDWINLDSIQEADLCKTCC